MFKTIEDGSLALLGETCELLNQTQIEYLIVGGWSPYFLNSNPILHPGTKDVDLLFKSGTEKGELKELIQLFLKNDFVASAKHPFQLLKTFTINGIEFMFNIDLLHPDNQAEEPEKYVDHIDFPVQESKALRIDYSGKTILLPKSDNFFDKFITKQNRKFKLSSGKTVELEFNLLDEAGLIISKSRSYSVIKRTRDAFDIYLAIKQARDYDKLINQLTNISNEHIEIKNVLEAMNSEKGIKILNANTYQWMSKMDVEEVDRDNHEVFEKFFNDLKK